MYKNQLTFHNHENGMKVAQMLLEENNVVMLSYEEDLLVLNWEWTPSAQPDRNYVVFMSRDEYEEEQDEIAKEIREYCEEKYKEKKVRSTKADGLIEDDTEEPKCSDCIYYDDVIDYPMCDTCKHNYPNNCVVK